MFLLIVPIVGIDVRVSDVNEPALVLPILCVVGLLIYLYWRVSTKVF